MKGEMAARVLNLLGQKGELPMKDICVHLGYNWPGQLENARGVLIAMEKRGLVAKTVRPSYTTRIAYYAVTPEAATELYRFCE